MFAPRSIKHCRACGGEVRYQTPADDNRDRATCIVCTTIHYENPLNVVGTLPVWEDKVLLCRRFYRGRHSRYPGLPAPQGQLNGRNSVPRLMPNTERQIKGGTFTRERTGL